MRCLQKTGRLLGVFTQPRPKADLNSKIIKSLLICFLYIQTMREETFHALDPWGALDKKRIHPQTSQMLQRLILEFWLELPLHPCFTPMGD